MAAATKTTPVSHRLAARLKERCRARCCSTASRAGAIRPMPRTTRSSRSAWWCRKTDDDVRAALAIAREEGVPLLPRGGATSQSGQTVGRALVIDFSKHLNRLIAVDAAARTCIVEPGIVLDELNRQLRPSGLWFPGRCLHLEPRHHRRHGRQQLLRHALDPLRHHARQRPRHRRDPGRRQRKRASARWATTWRRSCAAGLPPPCGEGGEGRVGDLQPASLGSSPTPNPLPASGEGDRAAQAARASHTSRCSATCSRSAGARRSTLRTRFPRSRAASAAI